MSTRLNDSIFFYAFFTLSIFWWKCFLQCRIAKVDDEKKPNTNSQNEENRERSMWSQIKMKLRHGAHTHTQFSQWTFQWSESNLFGKIKELYRFYKWVLESFFFPVNLTPLHFDILARDWLLFCFIYAAVAAATATAASVAKAVN